MPGSSAAVPYTRVYHLSRVFHHLGSSRICYSQLPRTDRQFSSCCSKGVGISCSFGFNQFDLLQIRGKFTFKVLATAAETEQPKWWEKNAGPNMIDVHSTEEFVDALGQAGDRLVIVEFFGTWCASCRALFPKICRIAEQHPEILFLKVNFDENKSLCKSLNVKVLPYFHFYKGADGLVDSFSCSLAKLQRLKDAIATHNTGPNRPSDSIHDDSEKLQELSSAAEDERLC